MNWFGTRAHADFPDLKTHFFVGLRQKIRLLGASLLGTPWRSLRSGASTSPSGVFFAGPGVSDRGCRCGANWRSAEALNREHEWKDPSPSPYPSGRRLKFASGAARCVFRQFFSQSPASVFTFCVPACSRYRGFLTFRILSTQYPNLRKRLEPDLTVGLHPAIPPSHRSRALPSSLRHRRTNITMIISSMRVGKSQNAAEPLCPLVNRNRRGGPDGIQRLGAAGLGQ